MLDTIRDLVHADLGPAPGHLIVTLRESQDFWADEDRDLIDPILTEFDEQCDDLAGRLADVWGEPDRVHLGEVLEHAFAGADIPPLPSELSQFAGEVCVWRVGDRVVCLGVGQHDAEFPVQLFAAVGDHWLGDSPR